VNAIADRYPTEVAEILSRYPQGDFKRSAVMPLLHLAQRETGHVTQADMQAIADLLEITKTEVASIVGFYSLYHDVPEGKYRLQVCTDLPCALRGADAFLAGLCQNLAISVGETTADGLFTIEEVKCLAGCHRAPLFQVQTGQGISYHENQTVETAIAFVEEMRKKERQPGEKETQA
jgi:NADH-quinone oxidoreductase subunit E